MVLRYNVRKEKVGCKIIYNIEDLEKIKAELEERKRIAQPPVYTQFRRETGSQNREKIIMT
jgi:hypothetical protein